MRRLAFLAAASIAFIAASEPPSAKADFCDWDKSGCCCKLYNVLAIPDSEMRKTSNGVCCVAGRGMKKHEVTQCSGDRDIHRSMSDGHTATFIWVCQR